MNLILWFALMLEYSAAHWEPNLIFQSDDGQFQVNNVD